MVVLVTIVGAAPVIVPVSPSMALSGASTQVPVPVFVKAVLSVVLKSPSAMTRVFRPALVPPRVSVRAPA